MSRDWIPWPVDSSDPLTRRLNPYEHEMVWIRRGDGDRPKVVHPRKLPLWFNVDGLEWRPCEEQSIESERTDLDRRLLAMADSHTADTEEDDRLLPLWGVIHRRHFSWSPRPGETLSVSSGKHQTAEVANAEAREMALAMGYTPPRWWQWWRWGERPLPGQNEPVGA